MQQVHQVFRDVWGYDQFRPLQEDSIRCVLDQQDSLTVLPTGGGKSLCFQAPALCRDGMAVVVSPLISLMKDQVDALKACGVAAEFANSTQTTDEKRRVAQRIRDGEVKLLYMAPERLLSPRTLEFLQSQSVSFFAIDEAHCISAWGHDFRPEYRGLRTLKESFPAASIHAYTATAAADVRNDIAEQLGLREAKILVGDFDRPNLTYRMMRSDGRLRQVMQVIGRHPGESGIIYCISRKEVEKTAGAINATGVKALPYHAGLDDHQRKSNQDAFIKDKCDVIVATVAFGMGIDKPDVRYVVHAGMPKSIEHYQQESGRAGRDGLASECVLIYSGGDVVTWKKMMDGGEGRDTAIRSLDAMSNLCTSATCRHKALVEYFGQQYEHQNCGSCDVCLGEIDLVDDPITLAQKILSSVIRQGERFGSAHTAKVLAGANDQRIRQFGHDQLSTYGLLADDGQANVRMWIDQLVTQGYLRRTGEYHVLSLSDTGRRLLKRDGDPKLTKPTSKSSKSARQAIDVSWEGVDRGLFDELRMLRNELASSRNVPAYVIFGDAPLREMARCRPDSAGAFLQIRGVGEQKAKDFGEAFLGVIQQYCQQHDVPSNVTPPITPKQVATVVSNPNSFAAFDLFRSGESIEAVAEKIGRAKSTVAGYLADYIAVDGVTDISPWVSEENRQAILQQKHLADEGKLKPIYDHFNATISYDDIRIALASDRHNG
ncbi:MAG: DNA helicase RecQ [Pirellulaceae bacterium]